MTNEQVSEWAVESHNHFEHPEIIDIVKLSELKPNPAFFSYDTEISYRRGFMHGIAQAVWMIRHLHGRGFKRSTEIANIIENWNHEILYPWRGKTSNDVRGDSKRGDNAMMGHPEFTHEPWESIRNRIIRRDAGKCVICTDVVGLEVDHIEEVQDGGIPSDDNLRLLCAGCHARKPFIEQRKREGM